MRPAIYIDTENAADAAPHPGCAKTLPERDPEGRPANTPGAKLDANKPRMGLVMGGFSRALVQVARVGTYGAKKYTDHGWVTVPNGIERYTDAMLRHYAFEQVEATDPETELLHAAHLAWNALARLELMLRMQSNSDGVPTITLNNVEVRK